jgi:AraC-like DNA-binding protein
VLWVERQNPAPDEAIRVLGPTEFHIDRAATIDDGLAMARPGAYDDIVLAIAGPYPSAVELLDAFRATGISTPVLVLMREPAGERLDATPGDLDRVLCELALSSLPLLVFIEAAAGVRAAIRDGSGDLASVRTLLRTPDGATLSPLVARAVATFGSLLRPRAQDVAAHLAVSRAHLGRLIQAETCHGFRELRSAAAIQRGARALAESATPIKAISHGAGFDHPSQFDREFRRVLGLSPRELRLRMSRAKGPRAPAAAAQANC